MDLVKSQLNISHLKMICTIEKYDTVKEAAEALFITQPALTNRIREAERRLKTQLFIRRGRKLLITNAGRRLLQSATKILEELARAEHDIARITEGIGQVLRISVPHYASFRWLPDVMSYFHKNMPEIELEIGAEVDKQPLKALFNGNSDIALVSSPKEDLGLDPANYTSVRLMEDELLAVVSNQHNLADKRYLVAQDFNEQTYITNSTVPEKDREYELFFKPANVIPQKVLQVGFTEAILELVKVNMGVSIMAKRLLAPFKNTPELTTIKLSEHGLKIHWHLVHTNASEVLEPANQLIDIIRHYAKAT